MRVHAVQMEIAWEDRAASLARARQLVEACAPEPGALVVFPEMFATGFSMAVDRVAEPPGGESEQFLCAMARERQVHLAAGLAVREEDGSATNQAVVVDRMGEVVCRYRKMQPFSLGGEGRAYRRGQAVEIVDIGGWPAAPFVCYDLRFPELFRAAVLRGARLLVVIANWPYPRDAHWVALLQARAIENLSYVVGVNRAGADPKLRYPGRSLMIDPRGQVLADAGESEGTVSAVLDAAALEEWRCAFPALEDIHPASRVLLGGLGRTQ